MALPDKKGEEDGSPVNILTLDPRYTYAIYSRDIGNPMIGVVLVREDELGHEVYEVYTDDYYFNVSGTKADIQPNPLGIIPVSEYINNEARMGAFEVVLPILNALNVLESNRTDSVEDFVNAFDVFQNCEIDKDTYRGLTAGGMAINIKNTVPGMESKVYRITSELSQSGVQTAIDDLYNAMLNICGMPSQQTSGNASTSDTGAATIMRQGWYSTEARAKDTEIMFKKAERRFLKVFLRICNNTSAVDTRAKINLDMRQIEIKCPRRNYENAQSKAQVLNTLLSSDYVHPQDAWSISDICPDVSEAYSRGMAWHEEQQAALEKSLQEELDAERAKVQSGGQDNRSAKQESDKAVSNSAK
jgi:SPP1 family phage portal protein